MAITLNARAQRAMTLDEYLRSLPSVVDPDDEVSIMASAWRLHSLALNAGLLSSTLSKTLEQGEASASLRPGMTGGCHAVLLGRVGRFSVHARIWPGAKGFASVPHYTTRPTRERALMPVHNHDFCFLTVGWFGPGCVFDVYECEADAAHGLAGEAVPIRFVERAVLGEGKVMFFRRGRDAHAVRAPEAVTVSLSLIIDPPDGTLHEQYLFDPERGCISGHVPGSTVSRMVTALQFAGLLGHGRARDILCDAAAHSPIGRIRAAAYEGLIGIDGWLSSAAQEWSEAMAKDPSPHVARLVLTR